MRTLSTSWSMGGASVRLAASNAGFRVAVRRLSSIRRLRAFRRRPLRLGRRERRLLARHLADGDRVHRHLIDARERIARPVPLRIPILVEQRREEALLLLPIL